jgi:hypothetical protein
MDYWKILASVAIGIAGYLGTNFVIAPILECRRLRKEVHLALITYANVWAVPSGLPEQEILYLAIRNREAANTYRLLSARITAFAEDLQHGKFYLGAVCLLKKYNFSDAAAALMSLEPDALNPEKSFRDGQVNKVKAALRIGT